MQQQVNENIPHARLNSGLIIICQRLQVFQYFLQQESSRSEKQEQRKNNESKCFKGIETIGNLGMF